MALTRREMLAFAAAFGVSETVFPQIALSQTGPVRVRQDIRTFAADADRVAALRAGVGKMKQRSAASRNDPRGWTYWAASHGTTDAIPATLRAVYGQCKHSGASAAPHFLSWHRPFLFYFEQTLKQAAQDAGARTDFDLPYWDWYTTPVIPAIFTEGTSKTNPLWHLRGRTNLAGATLDKSAFEQSDLLNRNQSLSFSFLLEDDPHGNIHSLVGGELANGGTADMGVVQRSARDPIFWLHHANIDRLWTAWIKGGSRNLPAADSAWRRQVFAFNVDKSMRQTVGPLLDTERSLLYRYENEAMPAPFGVVATAAPAHAPQALSSGPGNIRGQSANSASSAPAAAPAPAAPAPAPTAPAPAATAPIAPQAVAPPPPARPAVASALPMKTIDAPAVQLDLETLRNKLKSDLRNFNERLESRVLRRHEAHRKAIDDLAQHLKLSGTLQSFKLGQSPLRVQLNLAKAAAEQLHSLAEGRADSVKSAYLVLDGIEPLKTGRPGGFFFKIIASFVDSSGQRHRAVIGSLSTFGLSVLAAHKGEGTNTLRFPLPDILEALNLKSADELEKGLHITFEPTHPVESGPEPEYVKVGAVKIVAGSDAQPKDEEN